MRPAKERAPLKETRELVHSKWGDYTRVTVEDPDCEDDCLRAIEIVEEHLAGVKRRECVQ